MQVTLYGLKNFVFGNKYVYTYMHARKISEKMGVALKESREGSMGGFRRMKGKG